MPSVQQFDKKEGVALWDNLLKRHVVGEPFRQALGRMQNIWITTKEISSGCESNFLPVGAHILVSDDMEAVRTALDLKDRHSTQVMLVGSDTFLCAYTASITYGKPVTIEEKGSSDAAPRPLTGGTTSTTTSVTEYMATKQPSFDNAKGIYTVTSPEIAGTLWTYTARTSVIFTPTGSNKNVSGEPQIDKYDNTHKPDDRTNPMTLPSFDAPHLGDTYEDHRDDKNPYSTKAATKYPSSSRGKNSPDESKRIAQEDTPRNDKKQHEDSVKPSMAATPWHHTDSADDQIVGTPDTQSPSGSDKANKLHNSSPRDTESPETSPPSKYHQAKNSDHDEDISETKHNIFDTTSQTQAQSHIRPKQSEVSHISTKPSPTDPHGSSRDRHNQHSKDERDIVQPTPPREGSNSLQGRASDLDDTDKAGQSNAQHTDNDGPANNQYPHTSESANPNNELQHDNQSNTVHDEHRHGSTADKSQDVASSSSEIDNNSNQEHGDTPGSTEAHSDNADQDASGKGESSINISTNPIHTETGPIHSTQKSSQGNQRDEYPQSQTRGTDKPMKRDAGATRENLREPSPAMSGEVLHHSQTRSPGIHGNEKEHTDNGEVEDPTSKRNSDNAAPLDGTFTTPQNFTIDTSQNIQPSETAVSITATLSPDSEPGASPDATLEERVSAEISSHEALTASSEVTPNALSSSDDEIIPLDPTSTCFPASARVLLDNGSTRMMSELAISDRVHVGRGVFSDVYSFSHADRMALYTFVRLTTPNGSLLATANHYVYADGMLKTAGSVEIGSWLSRADGSVSVVTSVSREQHRGLYNPHTLQGDIAVDGFITSTYTSSVRPHLANTLLAPIRTLYRVGLLGRGLILSRGCDRLAKWAPKGPQSIAVECAALTGVHL